MNLKLENSKVTTLKSPTKGFMNIKDCKDEDLTNQQSRESLDIKNEPISVHYREPSNEI